MDKLIKQLDVLASSIAVTQNNVKGRHICLTGVHFLSLHPFFDRVYQTLDEAKDIVFEDIRKLGAIPVHSMTQMLEFSITDDQMTIEKDIEMAKSTQNELSDILVLISQICEDITDPILENDLTGLGSKIRDDWYWLSSFTS